MRAVIAALALAVPLGSCGDATPTFGEGGWDGGDIEEAVPLGDEPPPRPHPPVERPQEKAEAVEPETPEPEVAEAPSVAPEPMAPTPAAPSAVESPPPPTATPEDKPLDS